MSTVTEHINPDLLQDYADGILNSEVEDKISAHIFSCEECEQRLMALSNADQSDSNPDFATFEAHLTQLGWQKKKPEAAIRRFPRSYLIAAAIALLLGIVGLLTLYPPKPAPSQWEMARDSDVYPQFGAHAGASGSWVEEYQNRDWDQTVASLQPQVDAFLAQHAQDNEPVSYQEARMLLGLGSALLKQNPQNPFAAKPYLLAAQSQQTESSVAAEATYFLGLMYLLAGDLPTAEQTWQSLLVEPSPVQDRYVQEIKRLLSAS